MASRVVCSYGELMRLIFMGTPAAAVPTLQRCLDDGHDVVAVWTQPDRPVGRHQTLSPSPVKQLALSEGLTVHQPAKVRTDEAKNLFASHEAEAAIVVAYGRILPDEFLRAPRRGCINVHFSLLPLYRGAAPVNWSIVNGEKETGVTTMFVEPELDTGPILLQARTRIGVRETAGELMTRLSVIGADLLSDTLTSIHELTPRPQHDRDATFAPMLKREDGLIDWTNSSYVIERCVRGFQPWPGSFTHCENKRLALWNVELTGSRDEKAPPGELLVAHADDLVIKCGEDTALKLIEVQPEGKRKMPARDFLNGTHLKVGDRLGKSK